MSIGGDPILGSTPSELLIQFERDPDTKAVVLWGEPGTLYEEEAADLIGAGAFSKPLIVYQSGRFTESFPEGTVFGHAASIIGRGGGKPSTKMARLKEAGAHVAETFNDIIPLVQQATARDGSY